ncbi:ankyrin repeat-containing domain protein [Cercophora newfieldiana]|uniref:Ankyrin repeat-containing domain protein n=1 Tax=Cercophora newfieldiana TaxID=92897 RepID=A0AA39Y626_9PEZI|nr:ankyrin repeat-containing domain protein [Cercophora newfieldiana]
MSDPDDASSDSASESSLTAGQPDAENILGTGDTGDAGVEVVAGDAAGDSHEGSSPQDGSNPTEGTALQESEGLRVVWTASDEDPDLLAFDYVVVPGVYGKGARYLEESWNSPGSGSSQWVVDHASSLPSTSGSRVLTFEYPSRHLFSGSRSREAIRSCALSLLRGLAALRKDEARKRVIMFIAHDLGGIIVKDALVAGALEDSSWQAVMDLTRVLVFCGCPHRTASIMDLEDRLCRFFFADYAADGINIRPSASSVASLATAVTEVNGLFVNSKVPLRSRIISIHSGSQRIESGINPVFDSYCATFGVPLERKIAEAPGEEAYPGLVEHLAIVANALTVKYGDSSLSLERTLLSLASPVPPMQSRMVPDAPVTQKPEFRVWHDSKGPQILYAYGSFGIRRAAEEIFFALDDEITSSGTTRITVLYFSFDRWDVRFDSMRDVASTFLTQLVCQYPRLTESAVVQRMVARLSKERCWTEEDLLYWFDMVWSNDQLDTVICVFNHFDECVKGSRDGFLKRFSQLARASEQTRKLVVTSHVHGSLLEELSDYPSTLLDLSQDAKQSSEHTMHLPPEVLPQEDLVRRQWDEIAILDPLVRNILLEQAKTRRDWPDRVSLADLFGPLNARGADQNQNNESLTLLLDRILNTAPQPKFMERILVWLLYAVRPLSVSELTAALEMESDSEVLVPSPESVQTVKHQLETRLAGLFGIDHCEIKVAHPQLRKVMMKPHDNAGELHMWEKIQETAHYDIASRCLDYLCQPKVQESITTTYHSSRSAFSTDSGNLCSYALQAWTYHFSRVPPGQGRTRLSEKFSSDNFACSLAMGHWALSNRVMRSPQPPETLFPIFAGLGLINIAAHEPRNESDRKHGLLEAAANGHGSSVKTILETAEFPESSLLEALVAAATTRDEDLLLSLVDNIVSKSSGSSSIAWPSGIIYRAAWLGLDRFLDRMLTLGCHSDPPAPWECPVPVSPLMDAVRNSHEAASRVLIKHGANVTFRTVFDRTVLHVAAWVGVPSVVKTVVELGNCDLEVKDKVNRTPLYWTSLFGHHEAAEFLLKSGADPMMGSPSGEWTPLVAAADGGLGRCVGLLLEKGANPNFPGPQGTALRYAAVNGHVDICRLLLDAKADPRSPEDDPPILTQVIEAATEESMLLDVFNLLVERGADVNAKVESESVLMHAAAHTHGSSFVRILLEHNADISHVDEEGQTVLHHVATDGELATLELLLERGGGSLVNCLSNDGLTPLYNTIGRPGAGLLRVLLENGADPDLSRSVGFTALMASAWFGHEASVELLLKHKATVDLTYTGEVDWVAGWSAFACAVGQSRPSVAKLLAENGADMQCKSAAGDPIIMKAAIQDDETLSTLLEFPTRIDIHASNADGDTALHLSNTNMNNFRRLVNAGADVNAVGSLETPISAAAHRGDMERVAYLLEHGADTSIGGKEPGSALERACCSSSIYAVEVLVEHKADVNQTSESKWGTALSAACFTRSGSSYTCSQIVKHLLEHGAEVNLRGGWLGYPLTVAAYNMDKSVLGILLEAGAQVDVRDPMGRSPIHLAALHGIDNLQTIIDAGGDIGATDATKRTALHWAAAAGRARAVERILSLSPDASVDLPDIDGWTALCWACMDPLTWVVGSSEEGEVADQLQVIRLLLQHGANRSVVVRLGDEKWTPLKIARFCNAPDEVLALLKNGLDGNDNTESEPSGEEYETKKGEHGKGTCDFCYLNIHGFAYKCSSCYNFDFCFKCYPHKELFHPPEHQFHTRGSEFMEEEANNSDDSSSDTSSSTDSDDSNSGE